MCFNVVGLILSSEFTKSEFALFEKLFFILILKGVNSADKELHLRASSLNVFLNALHQFLIFEEQIPL